jgi:hypothetical protein
VSPTSLRWFPIPEPTMNKTSFLIYAGYAAAAIALYVILLVIPG